MVYKIIFTDYEFGNIDIEKEFLSEFDCEIIELQSKDESTLISASSEADALIVQHAPITARVIESLNKCKVISRYGMGVDTVDLNAAKEMLSRSLYYGALMIKIRRDGRNYT
ncbi:hypothetical protein ACFLQS_03745 [Actinomycetota bacterium]